MSTWKLSETEKENAIHNIVRNGVVFTAISDTDDFVLGICMFTICIYRIIFPDNMERTYGATVRNENELPLYNQAGYCLADDLFWFWKYAYQYGCTCLVCPYAKFICTFLENFGIVVCFSFFIWDHDVIFSNKGKAVFIRCDTAGYLGSAQSACHFELWCSGRNSTFESGKWIGIGLFVCYLYGISGYAVFLFYNKMYGGAVRCYQ